jgi:YebC/PmpR family DNA-binding regulatory protein
MSGHSHWATIKRAKASTDAKRGRLWSKLARKIIVAAKSGGGSPDENLSLRYAIDDAKAANMPNDTINKAIKKGTGELGAENYEPLLYEGYGAGGVAFIVDILTDNRNRTAPEIKKLFERAGGQMGTTGCVGWMFEQKGTFIIAADKTDEDALMEIALEAGADDVSNEGEYFEITCEVPAFQAVKQALAEKNIPTESAQIAMIPTNTIAVPDLEQAQKVLRLVDALEENDDVQNVYGNFDIPDDIMSQIQG